jgi:hypothetical protein
MTDIYEPIYPDRIHFRTIAPRRPEVKAFGLTRGGLCLGCGRGESSVVGQDKAELTGFGSTLRLFD